MNKFLIGWDYYVWWVPGNAHNVLYRPNRAQIRYCCKSHASSHVDLHAAYGIFLNWKSKLLKIHQTHSWSKLCTGRVCVCVCASCVLIFVLCVCVYIIWCAKNCQVHNGIIGGMHIISYRFTYQLTYLPRLPAPTGVGWGGRSHTYNTHESLCTFINKNQ